jgi:Tat protein secretion system quality control protein TatD with DNase activity
VTLVDSHCHLEYEGLAENQQGVLERARAAGIGGFLNISTRRSEWGRVVGTAERETDVWASIGIHPHEADQHADMGEAALLEAAAHPRVIGIGGFLNISTRRSEWGRVVGTAEREPDVWASIGIHPHEADQHADLGEAALLEAAEHPKVVGIGETGLYYYYD